MPENFLLLAAKGVSPAQAVQLQALDDYPKQATKWMNGLPWAWPVAVPLDQIDFSNKDAWTADEKKSKSKISKFEKKMHKGILKPAILVRPKGEKKYVVADGHHRALACLKLGRPLMAWTTDASEKQGGWSTMHDMQDDQQIKATSDLETVINLAADSLQKASTPQPLGPKPLWKKTKPKPWHLPFYIEHVAHALRSNGHSESEAISMAVGIVRGWASGKPEGGEKKLQKTTQAAAAKAISEWEALKSAAHASKGKK